MPTGNAPGCASLGVGIGSSPGTPAPPAALATLRSGLRRAPNYVVATTTHTGLHRCRNDVVTALRHPPSRAGSLRSSLLCTIEPLSGSGPETSQAPRRAATARSTQSRRGRPGTSSILSDGRRSRAGIGVRSAAKSRARTLPRGEQPQWAGRAARSVGHLAGRRRVIHGHQEATEQRPAPKAKRRRTKERTVPVAQVVSMKQLLESGVHFGHQTRRWNPKMKRYIFTERNGIYIIDLQQSLDYIDRAYEFIKETVAHGGTILYVGTKKQAQEAIAEQARRVGMPFVNQRWLGGMLTNFSTVYKRLHGLKRERDKLDKTLGGIRDMARVPSAIWVVDTKKEHIAVNEARKLNIPVVAILDTNCDPDEVNYPIPGSDDASRSVALLTRVVADAVADGLMSRAGASETDQKPSDDQFTTSDEPLPE